MGHCGTFRDTTPGPRRKIRVFSRPIHLSMSTAHGRYRAESREAGSAPATTNQSRIVPRPPLWAAQISLFFSPFPLPSAGPGDRRKKRLEAKGFCAPMGRGEKVFQERRLVRSHFLFWRSGWLPRVIPGYSSVVGLQSNLGLDAYQCVRVIFDGHIFPRSAIDQVRLPLPVEGVIARFTVEFVIR